MRLALLLLLFCSVSCSTGPVPPTATVKQAEERLVIDTRVPTEFALGHAPGAINIQLGWDQLEDRIRAYVPDQATSLALRVTDEAEARAALAILTEQGYADIVLIEQGQTGSSLETWTAAHLSKVLENPSPPIVIDVRSRGEYERGTIDGALLLEQDEAPALLDDLDREAHYAIICEGGYRSSQLASLMRRQGFTHVVNVIDGMAGWRALD